MAIKAKDLKSLSRGDLLELLLAQTERVEELEQELAIAKEKVESKDIFIEKAGTLAEAALSINRVWQAADQAAAQYLENVLRLYDEQMVKVAKLEQECNQKKEALLGDATASAQAMERETTEKCRAMEQETADKCRAMEEQTAEKCKAAEAEAQSKLEAVEQKCRELESSTEATCAEMKQKAQEESQAYWDTVYNKLEQYCASRGELSALLQMKG